MKDSGIADKVEQQARSILRNSDVRHVVLGLSGGADSVALLCCLLRLGLKVDAVHCNFHLRGEESNRDMVFCQNLCRRLNMPLDVVHFDVPAYRQAHNLSTEEACRELRYDYFRERMAATGADRIAVAHHADDNIETMFLNLFRGAGISGLRAMLPDANGIIRPLITTTRQEILTYLEYAGQDYIVDSTNLSSDYRRNFIRNELLPAIESRWTGARKAMINTISNLQSDERALNAVAEQWLNAENDNYLSYDTIRSAPDMQWLLHRWLSRYGCRANVAREISGQMSQGRPANGKRWKAQSGTILATRKGLEYIPMPDSSITNS